MFSGRLSNSRRNDAAAKAELGGDHDLVANGRQGFAEQFLVGERAIGLSAVEEGDAKIKGPVDRAMASSLPSAGPLAKLNPHAAQSDGRDFEAADLRVFMLIPFLSVDNPD